MLRATRYITTYVIKVILSSKLFPCAVVIERIQSSYKTIHVIFFECGTRVCMCVTFLAGRTKTGGVSVTIIRRVCEERSSWMAGTARYQKLCWMNGRYEEKYDFRVSAYVKTKISHDQRTSQSRIHPPKKEHRSRTTTRAAPFRLLAETKRRRSTDHSRLSIPFREIGTSFAERRCLARIAFT